MIELTYPDTSINGDFDCRKPYPIPKRWVF